MKGLAQVLPFVLLAVLFWLLLIRPQRRRQMELLATQNSVEVGSEVMLGAGIYGRVAAMGDEFVQLEISPGTRIKVARGAVVRVVEPDDAEGADPGPGPDESDGADDGPGDGPDGTGPAR